MSHHHQQNLGGRNPNRVDHFNAMTRAQSRRRVRLSNRARGWNQGLKQPFVPPEQWHEPQYDGRPYQLIAQPAGEGFRHVVTPQEIHDRLAALPRHFLKGLEVVQLSQMTRKKQRFPCYGMQWGSSLYLYPIEENLVEWYSAPPKPGQLAEAKMYGGRWEREAGGMWKLVWTEESIRDFYLNNILIHELGHLLDDRNTRSVDRERYAEWFALEYGYKPTRGPGAKLPVTRRHAKRSA
jgi:hypothetical protein